MRVRVMILAAAAWPALATAQQQTPTTPSAAPAAPGDDEPEDVVVTGSRTLPGSVVGDIPPDQQLGPADIRSYGVSTVSDLLTELAPQTRSGVGGAPVVLLNGKRIAGFQEIRDIPTEAIARVDILPEEVALKYGYRADQRVVNIVLRRRFRATTAEATDRVATDGGRNTPGATLDVLDIANGGRFNVHGEVQQSSALTESERDIAAATTEGATTGFDQRPYRTLLPFSRTASGNIVYAQPIGSVSATVNGRVETTDSIGRFGLPSITLAVPAASPFAAAGSSVTRVLDGGDFGPLSQRNSAITSHLGTTLTGVTAGWNWSLTGAYDRVASQTVTDTGVDASPLQARLNALDPTANPAAAIGPRDVAVLPGNRGYSTSNLANADLLATGSLFSLPAGRVATSIRVGAATGDFDSRSYRAGVDQRGSVSRDSVNGRVNLDVPIASRSKGVLAALGTLSLNGNAAVDRLSDFGTLTTYGYGANWSPLTGVRLIASVSDQDEAPSAQQLGNPTIVTPNVRVFDYVSGSTVTVTTVTGGNPALVADNRHVDRIGLTLTPWSKRDFDLTASYVRTTTDDPIASFPAATAAIEAAFPSRFTRDGAGNLLRIDSRPINFARSQQAQLRYGFNLSVPLKSKIQKELEAFRNGTGPNPFAGLTPPGRGRPDGAPPRDRGGDAAGSRGEAQPPAGGGRGGGGGRLQFALYHTWRFTDRVTVANGGPVLDLLNGDAIGANGGSPRHELEGQAGYSNNGLGARLSVDYASGTRVEGGTPAAPNPLAFSSLTTANVRLFADFGQRLSLVRAHPWVRGVRLTLAVDNLFNQRQRVTDATGSTPISYQSDYLDPLGRTIRVSLRKLFS